MPLAQPKQKTDAEILILALKAKRVDDDTFELESETKKGKFWRVNIVLGTCRDRDGLGCPALYYYNDCKHLISARFILVLLDKWNPPFGS